jgi:hypothetical protein
VIVIAIAISPSASRRRPVTVIPRKGHRQRNGPWRLHQVGAGPFADDLGVQLGRLRMRRLGGFPDY